MLGWKLFARAVRLILDHLDAALRLSLLPYLLVAAATLWLGLSFPDLVGQSGFDPADPPPAGFVMGQLLVLLLNTVVTLWIAVGWHRFVLLAEAPQGWLPALRGSEMLGYFGRSILIGLLIVAVIFAVSLMLATLIVPIAPGLAGPVIGSAALFVGMILFYRLAVVLPAGAIGRSMTFGEAWTATAGHTGTVVVLALLTVGFTLLLQVPTLLDGTGGLVTLVYQVVIGWIGLMLGVGVLTALYGHLVEGRPVE